jgi:hypothetical protein
MILSATPPTWLKGRTLRNTWRRCLLYEDSIQKRDLEFLRGYVETLDKAITVSTLKDDVGRKMDVLIHRKSFFYSESELQADLKRCLQSAQHSNDAYNRLRQLVTAFEKELLALNSTKPELRSLISGIVPVGRTLLGEIDTNSRSITIKSRGKNG